MTSSPKNKVVEGRFISGGKKPLGQDHQAHTRISKRQWHRWWQSWRRKANRSPQRLEKQHNLELVAMKAVSTPAPEDESWKTLQEKDCQQLLWPLWKTQPRYPHSLSWNCSAHQQSPWPNLSSSKDVGQTPRQGQGTACPANVQEAIRWKESAQKG